LIPSVLPPIGGVFFCQKVTKKVKLEKLSKGVITFANWVDLLLYCMMAVKSLSKCNGKVAAATVSQASLSQEQEQLKRLRKKDIKQRILKM
jgi:hypothetical protein